MPENNKCPLCGKPKQESDKFCEECQNHIDNQYTTDLFLEKNENNQFIEKESDIEPVSSSPFILLNKEEKLQKPKRKKKLSKTYFFIIICCILIVVLGTLIMINVNTKRQSIEFEQKFWDSCVVVNTPLSYAKYLVTFQNGIHIDEAHKRIRDLRLSEDMAWDELKNSNDINDYYNYISNNPNTPYATSAHSRMDSLSWANATNSNTADAYLAYLDNVKLGNLTGVYSTIAQDKYDYLSQIKNIEGETLDSIRVQLESFYSALSMIDDNTIQKNIATNLNFYSNKINNTDIVSLIKKEMKDKKIKKRNYTIETSPFNAIRDNKGITFIDLILKTETINTANKKSTSTDSLKIELNKNNKIQLISPKL